MEIKDIMAHAVTIGGVIFGFGWQASQNRRNSTDINNLGRKHQEIVTRIDDVKDVVVRIDERVKHLMQTNNHN